MGDLIKFPGQAVTNPPVRADGEFVDQCTGIVHVFDDIPGRCQCGEHLWDDLILDPNGPDVGIHSAKGEGR